MRHDELLHVLRMWLDGSDDFPVPGVTLNPLLLEFLFWGVVISLALVLLWRRPRALVRAELNLREVARHRTLSILMVGVLALGIRVALLPLIPIPTPIAHDEFSYLLQADTFASGRLTNPQHPMWTHFEGFSINMRPTYQSMYPPGQASVLALSEALTGNPWWGVWLSIGIMCGAIVWMLQGWVPVQWALLGGLFCVLRYATFSYWIDSYWGGAVPATAGALLLGALARLVRKPSTRDALVLALGLVILANTRPYEGFVFSLPAIIFLLVRFIRQRMWTTELLSKVAVPVMAVLLLAAAFGLYYNWRSTGNPLLMPYVVNERTYHISRPFLWQTARPVPAYHHRVMRTFYSFHELPEYFKSRQVWGLEEMTGQKLQIYYVAFVWPLFLLMFFALWQMMKSRKQRLLAITPLVLLAGLLVESWFAHSHYAAQALCAMVAIAIYGLRMLRVWKPRGIPVGLMTSRAIVLVMAIWMLFSLGEKIVNPYIIQINERKLLAEAIDRARLEAQLNRMPGQHLVIVHNCWSHTGSEDWIYNKPDIDHAKIVWARDMGAAKNEELLRYFANRQVWLVDQNDGIMRLNAYNERTGEEILASAPGLVANAGPQLAASRRQPK
jgi:hypothetical protein